MNTLERKKKKDFSSMLGVLEIFTLVEVLKPQISEWQDAYYTGAAYI